ncbi:CTP synthetase [uncultured Marivita sp.]|uniref:CTP synthetase n=1 Tax=uncultured Marivita sp. TaxID=888080 RepID=UPI002639EFBC|nr:CTP synthetase [uncultured Marivita sp.]
MFRLASILYSLIGTTLAGTAIIAVLTAGFDTLVPIVAAAVIGALVALPVTYFVTRAVYQS